MLPLALTGSGASAFFLKPDTRREWASSKELLALHQWNWDIYGNDGHPVVDPFSKENTHCKLQVRERDTSKFLWETPTFPFENLWVSPDSAFIVGLASHAKLPYHLLVYGGTGRAP
jgi:hypothetical protein